MEKKTFKVLIFEHKVDLSMKRDISSQFIDSFKSKSAWESLQQINALWGIKQKIQYETKTQS